MVDEEQFSLCWNNFNSNLSAGFHESLCRGDLVDVTLAAEGQLVKAHRLVLSVCSPYFRKMFTQMPANQHAFVFLKDVSHTALKDLIQFMYCGEVNVKQDALPTFISTAEALQIKGLTETGESASTPAANTSAASATSNTAAATAPSPMKVPTPAPSTASTTTSAVMHASPTRSQQQRATHRRTAAAAAAYKLESEDSSDEKPVQQVVTQKRTVQRSLGAQSAPAQKRQRQDPIEAAEPTTIVHVQAAAQPPQQQMQQTQQQLPAQAQIVQVQVQQQPIQQQQQIISAALSVSDDKSIGDAEFIDLPIEMPATKAEPDYGEELGDVETIEQEADHEMDQEHDQEEHGEEAEVEGEEDATYVEDDAYGDMKYDESYFTENDDTKAGASGFSESYTEAQAAETSGTEAQDDLADVNITFAMSPWSTPCMIIGQYLYNCHSRKNNRAYWRCHNYSKKQIAQRCRARCVIVNGHVQAMTGGAHNHAPHTAKIDKIMARECSGGTAQQFEFLEPLGLSRNAIGPTATLKDDEDEPPSSSYLHAADNDDKDNVMYFS